MFATPALIFAVAPAVGGAAGGLLSSPIGQMLPFLVIPVLFYVLMIRPQQQRARQHAATIGAVKRGDTVVMSNGMIGKVVRVEDTELGVEIAQNVTVKVVKAMISEVRTRGEPAAANDAKS
ncbi:MAG TPA: preprotein translocase subunit YajC [Caulobacteraceae bacterium]|nr:preprotein translocase subunit YajC [Caulobacteraceae bacterium]